MFSVWSIRAVHDWFHLAGQHKGHRCGHDLIAVSIECTRTFLHPSAEVSIQSHPSTQRPLQLQVPRLDLFFFFVLFWEVSRLHLWLGFWWSLVQYNLVDRSLVWLLSILNSTGHCFSVLNLSNHRREQLRKKENQRGGNELSAKNIRTFYFSNRNV